MMYWYGNGMNGWGVALTTIGNLVFWGLVVAAIIVLVRVLGRRPSGRSFEEARPAPEQMLAERFARGEIDEETYRRDLRTLEELQRR